jgi:hypothetical protein|tara:strand:- start:8517 stop:9260 length:744 start_codon:yes stop_codon:yes gene_type:complete
MSKFVVMADWDDVPHLSGTEKAELFASIPPHQRDARTKGVPQLGSGAIYPVPETDIVIADFDLPAHYARGYGMDVGWNCTAVVWLAHDRETGVRYVYAIHKRGEAEPSIHADAVRSRGVWIPGRIDPASRGRSQRDGTVLIDDYVDQGLFLDVAPNAVEAGILDVWRLLSTGQLKVFQSCHGWLEEFRLYRRDLKGRIVKQNDHLMDATRYAIVSGVEWMTVEPSSAQDLPRVRYIDVGSDTLGWMH